MQRGKITGRWDVNYWASTQLFNERYATPLYPLEPLSKGIAFVQYGCSDLANSEGRGLRIVRMNNLQADGWDFSDIKYVPLGLAAARRYRLKRGDVLFNRTNSKELVGKCDVFRERGVWVFASYLIRVRFNEEILLPDFVATFLNTSAGRLQIDRTSRQIIGMTNVNAEELQSLVIPLPDTIKQGELVAAMDAARASRRAKLAEANALFAGLDGFLLDTLGLTSPPIRNTSVYAVAATNLGKRIDAYSNQPRFRQLFKLLHQSGYSISTFGELADRIFSGTTPLAKGDAYATPPDGVRFIRSGEITGDGEVTPVSEVHIREDIHNGIMKRSQLERGDLLIAIVGATIGAVGIFDRPEAANINQAIAVVRLKDAAVSPEFACLYLWSSVGQALLDYFKRPVARANINLEEIAEIPLVIPPKDLQTKVIEEARRCREEVRRLRAEAEADWQAAKQWFEAQLLGDV